MISTDRVADLFKTHGALMEGHFLLTSGLHSPKYVEKFRVFEHPEATAELCGAFADHFKSYGVETVVGPVTGGIILAHETAKQLGVRCVFTEREAAADGSQKMTFRRGFQIRPGERVIIVEDILTTGRSILEVLDALKARSADVAGIGVLVDRSGGKVDFGYPLFGLMKLDIPTYKPESCPLCQQGSTVVKPGSRSLPK